MKVTSKYNIGPLERNIHILVGYGFPWNVFHTKGGS